MLLLINRAAKSDTRRSYIALPTVTAKMFAPSDGRIIFFRRHFAPENGTSLDANEAN
jgi:hypothetical protein